MTYGEKFKEVFGYYPCDMPCPEKCPHGRNTLNCHEGFGCEYFGISVIKNMKKRKQVKNEEISNHFLSRRKRGPEIL